MKTLRVCFLVLLALLLPVRSVVAAAMACPMGGGAAMGFMAAANGVDGLDASDASDAAGTATPAQAGGEPVDHRVDGRHGNHGHPGQQGHADGHDDHNGHGGPCSHCAAFCCLTPMPGTLPAVAAPQAVSSTNFPEVPAAAPSFLSGGQDRPPRSA